MMSRVCLAMRSGNGGGVTGGEGLRVGRGLWGQQRGEEVAVVGYAGEGVLGGEEEVLGLAAGLDLVPGDGGGDGGELAGAH